MWKTAFLLAMTSGCRALCCKPLYIRFTPAGVILFMRLGFLPKAPTKANTCCVINVPATHNHPDMALHKLCVRRALKEYMRRTGTFRQKGTSQLFMAYGRWVKGKPISKKRLTGWLIECIIYAYNKHDLPVPEGVKGYQTCKMAVTYVDMAGVDPQTICEAATWQSTFTFAKCYRLEAVAA